jgi:hypothetical protein
MQGHSNKEGAFMNQRVAGAGAVSQQRLRPAATVTLQKDLVQLGVEQAQAVVRACHPWLSCKVSYIPWDRKLIVTFEGARILQAVSQGKPLFTDHAHLCIKFHPLHDKIPPAVVVTNPVFNPHVSPMSGFVCWDDREHSGWRRRLRRDVGCVVKHVMLVLCGVRDHIAEDVFTKGEGHFNKDAALFYRQNKALLPFEKRPLFSYL